MFRRAESALGEGHSVVIDATFPDRKRRAMAAAVARRSGAAHVPVECRCPEKTVVERLRERRKKPSLSDADVAVYRELKKRYLPPRRRTVRVRTDRDLESACAQIAAAAFPL